MADYLVSQGVETSRMTITDGGANNPVGDNKTAAGRTLNRRVEIELSVR
jgi:outer membrane protein OmpA-like peptidoglycan-associated protein